MTGNTRALKFYEGLEKFGMNNTNQTLNLPIKGGIQPSLGESITSLSTGSTYTIGPRIGEGNFGIVYSCSDDWDNELAVKVLKPILPYEKLKKNAKGEFFRLRQLRHPNITFVYDAFEHRNTFYIVTERCHSPISVIFDLPNLNGMYWFMPMARHLLQAVHYLHLNNYVHQDIHEGNVFSTFIKDEMIPQKDQVIQFKLGDLGVAKLFSDVNAMNTRPKWLLPPEVLDSNEFGPIDHRVDIYHLGLLFLQLAYSKRLQFTPEEILSGKPKAMALQLPSPYKTALEKALRRHVPYRTASAVDLWRDFKGLSNI